LINLNKKMSGFRKAPNTALTIYKKHGRETMDKNFFDRLDKNAESSPEKISEAEESSVSCSKLSYDV